MLRLITDFDGPIIDVSERYYQVYKYCLETSKHPGQSVKPLDKAEFWQLKRSRVLENQIGIISGLDETQAKTFAQLRRQTVHTPSYFSYDSLAPGAVAALEKVQAAGIDLAVMTMRRVKELDYAFNRYDLGRFFPKNLSNMPFFTAFSGLAAAGGGTLAATLGGTAETGFGGATGAGLVFESSKCVSLTIAREQLSPRPAARSRANAINCSDAVRGGQAARIEPSSRSLK